MSVKSKTVDSFEADCSSENKYEVVEMMHPQKTKETVTIEGNPDDIATELLDVLKNKIKVI